MNDREVISTISGALCRAVPAAGVDLIGLGDDLVFVVHVLNAPAATKPPRKPRKRGKAVVAAESDEIISDKKEDD